MSISISSISSTMGQHGTLRMPDFNHSIYKAKMPLTMAHLLAPSKRGTRCKWSTWHDHPLLNWVDGKTPPVPSDPAKPTWKKWNLFSHLTLCKDSGLLGCVAGWKIVAPSSCGVEDCLTLEDRHYVLTKCQTQMLRKTLSTLIDSNTHKNISFISGTISSE